MRQLKVIVNDEASLAIAAQGGYVTANFVSPIEIKAGSLICLDKFNATSKNISQNFTVVGQTFTGRINGGFALLTGFTDVVIPSGSYATVADYMATINNYANAYLLTASTNWVPNAGLAPYVTNNWEAKQNQLGVGLTISPFDGVLSQWSCINYGLSPYSTTASTFWTPSSNLTVTTSGTFLATDALSASIVSNKVMIGGGLATTVILALQFGVQGDWVFGFESSLGSKLGGKLVQNPGNANLFVRGDNGTETEITNSQSLFPGAYTGSANSVFVIFQKAGRFGFSYCDDITDDNSPVTEFCIVGTYAGAMGTWSYNEQYTVLGEYPLGDTSPPCIGPATYTPALGGVFTPPWEGITQCGLNLTGASQLALITGFQPVSYSFGQEAVGLSSITSTAPFNVNQLRSAFELAIEILDIPLKTFFAQTKNSQYAGAGGRQNVICYFTPTPSNETEGLYSFANAVHQWLEIDNKSSTYLHSLSFRIFNPYSGLSFISNSMGFNLLISEPEATGQSISL